MDEDTNDHQIGKFLSKKNFRGRAEALLFMGTALSAVTYENLDLILSPRNVFKVIGQLISTKPEFEKLFTVSIITVSICICINNKQIEKTHLEYINQQINDYQIKVNEFKDLPEYENFFHLDILSELISSDEARTILLRQYHNPNKTLAQLILWTCNLTDGDLEGGNNRLDRFIFSMTKSRDDYLDTISFIIEE